MSEFKVSRVFLLSSISTVSLAIVSLGVLLILLFIERNTGGNWKSEVWIVFYVFIGLFFSAFFLIGHSFLERKWLK